MHRSFIFFAFSCSLSVFSQAPSGIREGEFKDSIFLEKRHLVDKAYNSNSSVLIVQRHLELGRYFYESEVYTEALSSTTCHWNS